MPGSGQDTAGGGGKGGEKTDNQSGLPALGFSGKGNAWTGAQAEKLTVPSAPDASTVQMPLAGRLPRGRREAVQGKVCNCNHTPRLKIHWVGRGRNAVAGLRLKKSNNANREANKGHGVILRRKLWFIRGLFRTFSWSETEKYPQVYASKRQESGRVNVTVQDL